MDERAAVDRLKRGDVGGLEMLVDRYHTRATRAAYLVVRDRALAEDVAQEAFVKAFTRLDTFDPAYKFSSWLFKIANNVAIDHLRKRHVDTISMDGSPHATSAAEVEATSFDVSVAQETPLEELESRVLGTAIERAIAKLRPEYRSCIMLRHVEGRSYEEIAATLGVKIGTIRSRIHRGRSQLRAALAHRAPVA